MRRKAEAPAARPLPATARLLMTHGPTAVMEAEWRDPEDVQPDARRHSRTIRGHRAYDPLRWSRRRHGDASSITELHVHAADRLRRAYDLAALGGLPGVVWLRGAIPHQTHYQPLSGPRIASLAMLRAHREFRRAMAIFVLRHELFLIAAVVLENTSISAWTRFLKASGKPSAPQAETKRLVAALDKLVQHYDTEIKEDMAMGRVEA